MLSDKITSFFFLKEEKVAFNEKKKDTLKYLSIIIKICFIYLKKIHKHHHTERNYMTFREM